MISREEPPPRYILYNGDSVQVISSGDMIRWRLVVSRGWKGPPLRIVEIYAERSEVSCGFEFQLQGTYLVYAYTMESDWWTGRGWPVGSTFPLLATNLCSRTQELERADYDLAQLGSPTWSNVPQPAMVLRQNRPNPFNPFTLIEFDLPTECRVGIRVFDSSGRLVRTLLDEVRPAGASEAIWDGRDDHGAPVASGVYFYEARAAGWTRQRRMVLLR
ncbi:MAG TPA: FlgD immunoglobulin-like domain containing protein [Candidatus Eisenbacteria bacterium]|nr:FlgD immunoglobulin-like domain containing protein [Candidatus Eisenbacteria bacterium]